MSVDPHIDPTADHGPVDGMSVGGSVALPFACRHPDGTGEPDVVIKARGIQCALSRICGVCGFALTRPVALVGSADEVAAGELAFPPCHESCAGELAAARGHVVVTTGGFDLLRPTRRGGPVAFHPNSVLTIDGAPV